MQYESFCEFAELDLIPKQAENPTHLRLDGKVSGGNRAVFGTFFYRDKYWKVHSDSSYEPLHLAYQAITEGNADPFEEKVTRNGICLVLKDEIQRLKAKPHIKHLYIYAM